MSPKQREHTDTGPAGVSPDQDIKKKQTERERIELLFHSLHLEKNKNTLKIVEVLRSTAHSLKSHMSCAEEKLVWSFIQQLLMMNYKARYNNVKIPMNNIAYNLETVNHLKTVIF